MTNSTAVQSIDETSLAYVRKNMNNLKSVYGLQIIYSNVNQSYLLMWYDNVIGVGTLADMIDRYLKTMPATFSYEFQKGNRYVIFNDEGKHVATLLKY